MSLFFVPGVDVWLTVKWVELLVLTLGIVVAVIVAVKKLPWKRFLERTPEDKPMMAEDIEDIEVSADDTKVVPNLGAPDLQQPNLEAPNVQQPDLGALTLQHSNIAFPEASLHHNEVTVTYTGQGHILSQPESSTYPHYDLV